MEYREIRFFSVLDELIDLLDAVDNARILSNDYTSDFYKRRAALWAQAKDAQAPTDATRRASALTLLANDLGALVQGRAPQMVVDSNELSTAWELVEQERVDDDAVKPFLSALRSRASAARRASGIQSTIQFKNALFDDTHKERALELLNAVRVDLERKANDTTGKVKVDSRKHKDALIALLDGKDAKVKAPLHYALANPVRQALGRLTFGVVNAAISAIENINVR